MTREAHDIRKIKYVATVNDEALPESMDPDWELEYVDIGNVEANAGITGKATYRFEDAPSRARRRVRHGDVIVSTVRTYLQAIAPIVHPPANLVVSTGFAVVRPVPAKLDSGFCRYVLSEQGFLAEVERRSVGVSYPAINASDLAAIPVAYPPLPRQRAIAAFLDRETTKIDAMIAAKERLLALLAEKRRALIAYAVTRGINPSVPLRESGLSWIGLIPRHWSLERLKFQIDGIEQGWSPQCLNMPAAPDEWGVLKAGCVNGPEFDQTENKTLPPDLEPQPELEVRPGDVLMSRSNTVQLLGSTALVRDVRPKLLLCDKLYRIHTKSSRVHKPYLVQLLRSPPGRFEFERDATGASNSMQNIGQDSVKNVWLPLPPVDEQELISEYIDRENHRADTVSLKTAETIALLRERRAALIAAAVTGQLRVEDAA